MKALLLLTSILAISAPTYGSDYLSITDNVIFHDHQTQFFKETEAPIRNQSLLQLHSQGTATGLDIQDFITRYNHISFTDPQYDDYFSDHIPYRTTYFTIKVQSVVNGNVSATILYQEDYASSYIPFSIDTLNAYGTTYIDYTNATKNYISTLNHTTDYHIILDYYFPIKNFAYPSQIGDQITAFVFDVYFSNSKHYAYLIEENFDEIYDVAYDNGYNEGYDIGHEHGFEDGQATQINEEMGGFFIILRQAFNSIAGILAIQLFPGFTLGLLLFIPLIFGIAFILIKFLLGGS